MNSNENHSQRMHLASHVMLLLLLQADLLILPSLKAPTPLSICRPFFKDVSAATPLSIRRLPLVAVAVAVVVSAMAIIISLD